jgi:hypothetical protein
VSGAPDPSGTPGTPGAPGPDDPPAARGRRNDVRVLGAEEVDVLRRALEERVQAMDGARWNADPDDVRRSVVRLVLTLVEFLRQLLERQALRRMEHETLTAEETENVGLALMRLEETVHEIAEHFDIPPGELNLDLGPLGRLM